MSKSNVRIGQMVYYSVDVDLPDGATIEQIHSAALEEMEDSGGTEVDSGCFVVTEVNGESVT